MHHAPSRHRVIIYVPPEDRERWEAACLDHCTRHGHKVVGVVIGGHDRWLDVMSMIKDEEAEIIVVARHDHLPPDRVPRVEVVADEPPPAPRQRRTRPLRRGGGASP